MNTRVSFKVKYIPAIVEEISSVMVNFDLGVERMISEQKAIASWETSTVVDKKYISLMKKQLKKLFNNNGHRVIGISLIKNL